jgi:hypothetical protein
MKLSLGRIKTVDLRYVFENEASEFTPWLEQNTELLSNAVGLDITEVKREFIVGNFSCDLIGIESNTENRIIIENQIELTNHDHLGKLITYAAGLDAKYVIWISKKLREEHQKALEWLNENCEGISFFGVQISAIIIDDSKPAINFDVIVEPNTWGREVKQQSDQIDERHKKYLQYFTRLVSEYERIQPGWRRLSPQPSSWMQFGAGKAGFNFVWAFRGNNKFDIELYIDTKEKEENKSYFNKLYQLKDEIEKLIPGLSWEELPERRASRIALYYQMPTSIKNLTNNQMDELVYWAIEKMNIFKTVFPKYIFRLEEN